MIVLTAAWRRCFLSREAVPPAPQPPPVAPASPPITTGQGEIAFLNEGGIIVTKTRFMVHAQTYALANITSVGALTIPARRGASQFFILVGAIVSMAALVSLPGSSGDERKGRIVVLLSGVFLAAISIFAYRNTKDSYAVTLNTAGSEMRTCVSKDRGFILRVVSALNEAIVARG